MNPIEMMTPGSFTDATTPPVDATTMNPMEMMTPKSFTGGESPSMASIKEEPSTPSSDETSHKKPTKKRKSWGQVLPEPKTNLPPRKRAKTEDEKEQRRVERVLRNRRAAQSSRERKRLESEALMKRNKELENQLGELQRTNMLLANELAQYRRTYGIVTRSSSPLDSLRENAVTLSPELFGSQNATGMVDVMTPPHATVNPASLSPSLSPVTDSAATPVKEEPSMDVTTCELTPSTSPDLAQHPAVSHVGGDAKVVPEVANLDGANIGLAPAASDDVAFSLGDSYDSSSDADRFVLENGLVKNGLFDSPCSSNLSEDYLLDYPSPSSNIYDDFDISQFFVDDATTAASEPLSSCDFSAANHALEPKVHDLVSPVS
jgi:transcriptional activator HAC1